MSWISRNEAADRLEVTPQTISNFLKKGLLTGRILNGLVQVDESSLESFIEKVPKYSQREDELIRLDFELKNKEELLKKKDQDLTRKFEYLDYGTDFVLNLRNMLKSLLWNHHSDSDKMLKQYLAGRDIDSIADEWCVVRSTARYKLMGIIRRHLLSITDTINDLKLENSKLKDRNEKLSKKLVSKSRKSTKMTKKDINHIMHIRSILCTNISELNISNRARSGLRFNHIDTVEDIVQYKYGDLLRLRRLGKTTVNEIDQAVKSLGLELGMDLTVYRLDESEFNNIKN